MSFALVLFRIMVFGYISIDVVQAAVADLNVDLALEYCSQKLDECEG